MAFRISPYLYIGYKITQFLTHRQIFDQKKMNFMYFLSNYQKNCINYQK